MGFEWQAMFAAFWGERQAVAALVAAACIQENAPSLICLDLAAADRAGVLRSAEGGPELRWAPIPGQSAPRG